jgi:hypothetical protein
MSIKDTRKGILFYRVSLPIYEPYKNLDSPIIRCTAKRIRITGGDDLLNLEFMQENGCEEQSFSFSLPFSKKNIEDKLKELFAEFSLL